MLHLSQERRQVSLLTVGVLLAFVSLSVFGVYLFIGLKSKSPKTPVNDTPAGLTKDGAANDLFDREKSAQWETYTNSDYGYSVSYPGLLVRRERSNKGGYLHFVRFEENRYSSDKGVAVGVSENGLGVESVKIKKEMESSGGVLVKEDETSFLGAEAVRLDFEPKDIKAGEKRTVVIFTHNGKCYSVSTVPEQIERVLKSFKFL